jgi:hypothetical protein
MVSTAGAHVVRLLIRGIRQKKRKPVNLNYIDSRPARSHLIEVHAGPRDIAMAQFCLRLFSPIHTRSAPAHIQHHNSWKPFKLNILSFVKY